jgi:hypothetical protein
MAGPALIRTPPDPLRLNACPACHYSLQGLGETGVCPECGEAFDRACVVLHGYARGTRANVGNARPWVAILLLLLPLIQLLTNPNFSGMKWFVLGGMVAAVILLFAWRRFRTDAPGLVQVELSKTGCRQFDVARRERERDTPPTPWNVIETIEIGAIPYRKMVHIKLMPGFRWWQFSRAAVEAEVAGGDELAYALREQIAEWTGVPSGGVRPASPAGGFPVITKP